MVADLGFPEGVTNIVEDGVPTADAVTVHKICMSKQKNWDPGVRARRVRPLDPPLHGVPGHQFPCVTIYVNNLCLVDDHGAHKKLGLWVLAGLLSFLLVEKTFPDGTDGDGDEEEDEEETIKVSVALFLASATFNYLTFECR